MRGIGYILLVVGGVFLFTAVVMALGALGGSCS